MASNHTLKSAHFAKQSLDIQTTTHSHQHTTHITQTTHQQTIDTNTLHTLHNASNSEQNNTQNGTINTENNSINTESNTLSLPVPQYEGKELEHMLRLEKWLINSVSLDLFCFVVCQVCFIVKQSCALSTNKH